VKSEDAAQAYSYAIHPEVRAAHFALCNGRRLVVYDVAKFEPVLDVVAADYDRRWADIERILRPESLVNPAYRDFDPDFGLALQRMGTAPGQFVEMRQFQLLVVAKIEDSKCSANANALIGDQVYLASLDFPEDALTPLLSCLPRPLLDGVLLATSRSPFTVSLDQMVEVDLVGTLGPLTNGEHDSFVPIDVIAVRGTRFDPSEKPPRDPVPNYVHSLRRAFEILQGE